MRKQISSIAALALLVTLGAACSGGGAHRADSAPTTLAGNSRPSPSPAKPAAPASSAPTTPRPCPARAALSIPHHQRDGTTRTLVPGQPIALLACRYHGFNQPQPV